MEKVSLFVNRVAVAVSGVLVLLLTFMTVVDVLGRFLFNHPLPGTVEATEMGLVLIAYLTFGYTEHSREHVVIDTAYELLPITVKRIVYQFAGLISVVVISLLSWRLFVFSGRMKAGNYHTAVLGIKYATIVIIAGVGAVCYALSIISSMLDFHREQRRKDGQ